MYKIANSSSCYNTQAISIIFCLCLEAEFVWTKYGNLNEDVTETKVFLLLLHVKRQDRCSLVVQGSDKIIHFCHEISNQLLLINKN